MVEVELFACVVFDFSVGMDSQGQEFVGDGGGSATGGYYKRGQSEN